MRNTILRAASVLAAIAFTQPGVAFAADEGASGPEVSFGLSAATDYVWRGVSQSNENPAVFATVNAAFQGFYLGAGTENVDFSGIDQEYDLWAGYAFDFGKAKLDLGVVRYGYVDAPVNIDTLEVKAALSGSVGPASLTLAGYHTWDYFGSDHDATYVELSGSVPLIDKLSLSGALGRQQIDSLPDYTTWNLGLSYEVLKGAKVDVRYHDTDTSAFGSPGDSRVVGSFSIGF